MPEEPATLPNIALWRFLEVVIWVSIFVVIIGTLACITGEPIFW